MLYSSQAFPPLQTLRAFLAVAQVQSFTRAAEALGVTQTAVSHQIAQLEHWLGAPVFERERSAIRLTRMGEILLPSVRSSLAELSDALSTARRGLAQRKLVISTTPEFGVQWLAPRLESFIGEHSELTVSLSLEYRRANLAAGEADLAIWLGSGGPQLTAEQLFVEEEFVVCSPTVLANLPPREALLAAPLLHYEGARNTVLDWRRWYSQIYGVEGEAAAQALYGVLDFESGPLFQTFPEMLSACRGGAGFALVRSSLVADDLASGQLVRCFEESVSSDLHYFLVWDPQSRNVRDIKALCTWLKLQVGRGDR